MASISISSVRWEAIEKFLLFHGYVFGRQKGSHRSYVKEGAPRPIVLPIHGKAAPKYIVRQIIRQCGSTKDEFLRFIEEA